MPCFDAGPDDDGNNVVLTHIEWVKTERVEAALCAISGALEKMGNLNEVLAKVDWRGAGVTKKQYISWWAAHKQEDADRREREAAKQELEDKKTAAKNKLTAEERELLGLK